MGKQLNFEFCHLFTAKKNTSVCIVDVEELIDI